MKNKNENIVKMDLKKESFIEMNEEETMSKLIELFTEDKQEVLEETIKQKVKYRFIVPLRKSNTENINMLYKRNYAALPKESINLLNQTYLTIKNVHKLIHKKSLVDSNTLIRSAFENLIMGMMIYFDQNVYKEFKKLGLKDDERDYTKQQKLRNMFKSKLKLIDKTLFEDINNRQLKEMLDEYYDKLCFFTHSTLIVNEMVEAKMNSDEDFFLVIAKQNVFFIEILLNCCLKYINKDERSNIKYDYLTISWMILINDIDKKKYTKDYLSKYNGLLYGDINKEYLNKSNNEIKLLYEEMQKLEKIIKDDPIIVIEILKNILKFFLLPLLKMFF